MAPLPPKVRWAIFLGIALLALAVRLPRLGERPMHTDEAVNAYITGQLLAGEKYHYDPQDRHGPALYLAALPIARSAGAKHLADLSETLVRCVPVLWGVLTLLLFTAVAGQTGFLPAAIAALLWAIGPLPVYYSRYFIHETLFVAATLGFLLSSWRAVENKSLKAGIMAGVTAGFMLACKETALLHFAAFGLAALRWFWVRRAEPTRSGWRWSALGKTSLAAFAPFVILVVALYTWGGQHWQGPLDLLRSIPRFAARATGEGHQKPFCYYFKLLGGSGSGGATLALAVVGSVLLLRSKKKPGSETHGSEQTHSTLFLQLVLIYGIGISFIYSLIPYKTPWLGLNLWLPITLLAGFGLAALWNKAANKTARLALLLGTGILISLIGRNTWTWNFARPADERNPYAYAHTSEDVLRLPERIHQITAQQKTSKPLRIAVVAADPWPLPWYLRGFPNTGFWQPGQDPGKADLYITSPEAAETLGTQLQNYRPEFFGVRPEVLLLLWTPLPLGNSL